MTQNNEIKEPFGKLPKTLKDFMEGIQGDTYLDLRQEAINWVWFLKECMDMKNCPFYQPDEDEPKFCNTSCLEVVDWIKYFFNLKERDVE